MPGKKSTSKSTRKIDAAEAVERMDRAAKREMSTPPKPYQQEPDRSVGSGKTTKSSVIRPSGELRRP
jgi:hypothetical protein